MGIAFTKAALYLINVIFAALSARVSGGYIVYTAGDQQASRVNSSIGYDSRYST